MREYSARMEHMMYTPVTLPVTNEYGYFEIRLESIGGLGANLCGKMLGELGALYLSLNSLSFSSYGSEKRGSPVKSYIRWSPASTAHQQPGITTACTWHFSRRADRDLPSIRRDFRRHKNCFKYTFIL